jgi:ankyrin repeat protein
MLASSAGHLKIVQKLLKHKSDPNSQNDNRQSALHYAASKNRFEVTLQFELNYFV